MNTSTIFAWHGSPLMWLAGAILLWIHLRGTDYKLTAKTGLFGTGILLIECALALPMGPAPGQPLFSLHMARHIILLMLAPPLLVAGLPKKPVRNLINRPSIAWFKSIMARPVIPWGLGVGIMWFWHMPLIFNRMVTYAGPPALHLVMQATEVISLIGIGLLFSSPILFPLKKYRLPPLKGIIYLFTACTGCSILGILITFSSPGLYHTAFTAGPATVGGLTAKMDQQVGGLLMWVPGCFIYLSGVITLLIRWFSQPKPAHQSTRKKTATFYP